MASFITASSTNTAANTPQTSSSQATRTSFQTCTSTPLLHTATAFDAIPTPFAFVCIPIIVIHCHLGIDVARTAAAVVAVVGISIAGPTAAQIKPTHLFCQHFCRRLIIILIIIVIFLLLLVMIIIIVIVLYLLWIIMPRPSIPRLGTGECDSGRAGVIVLPLLLLLLIVFLLF